jgi:DNA processing protein
MDNNADIQEISPGTFPLLHEISDPPKKLYVQGTLPEDDPFYICVVGSRKYTRYGKEACEEIIRGLAGIDNIVIVSGLALGIDGIAHEAALAAGIRTMAVPGSGLHEKVLYPASHHYLARKILATGGILLSEFKPDFRATQWSFPKRNRIMAGLSHIVIIVEAEEKSGSLITARLATDYNRIVGAIPGPITSSTSHGPNSLIKDGALPVCKASDILEALGVALEGRAPEQHINMSELSLPEQTIILTLVEPLSRDEIIETSGLNAREANIAISLLESKGFAKEDAGLIHRIGTV